MTILEPIGVVSIIGAGLIAQVPAESVEAIGKWPVTIALIALSAMSVLLAFRSVEKSRQSQDEATKALRDLAQELAERPCIRRPENN